MNPHPRESTSLFGHDVIAAQLLELWSAGRLPHAVLLSGNKGIGKATLAYHLARHFLTPQQAENTGPSLFGDALPAAPSGKIDFESPRQKRITAGTHPDLLTIEPLFDEKKKEYKSEIVIGETRKIGEFLSLTPAEAPYRVVIVDSADEMNMNAANSILKLLEEPPPNSMLILVSHNPGRLLPTIRSRCLLAKVPSPDINDFNAILCAAEGEIEPTEAKQLAVLSDYAPGLALMLHETRALETYEGLLNLISQAPNMPPAGVAGLAQNLASPAKTGRILVLRTIGNLIRHASATPPQEECMAGESSVFGNLATTKPLDYWLELWEKANALTVDAERLNLDNTHVFTSILNGLEGNALP